MTQVILGRTGLVVNKNGFGALPIQRVSRDVLIDYSVADFSVCNLWDPLLRRSFSNNGAIYVISFLV